MTNAQVKYFDSTFIEFFRMLTTNNNRGWFLENTQAFEANVKKPFEAFVEALIEKIDSRYSSLKIDAKDCILRIHRDVRFSKDKSPYNVHCTAFISPAGKRDKTFPGLFIRLSAESVGIMGGCYSPSTAQIQLVRQSIIENPDRFSSLYNDKTFTKKFGCIQGDRPKKTPKHLSDLTRYDPLVLNKQWYFVTERKPSLIQSLSLMDEMMEYYEAAKPLNEFFIKSLSSDF
jgi:uncharacterized protein (TIGR02453 family)